MSEALDRRDFSVIEKALLLSLILNRYLGYVCLESDGEAIFPSREVVFASFPEIADSYGIRREFDAAFQVAFG